MKGRISLLSLFTALLLTVSTAPVLAVTPPDFPACSSQIGAPIIASYTNGTHGIPGDTKTYNGTDTVYALDGNSKVLQCLCADNGTGIQTTWWKASSLTEPDIKILVSMGWHYIQNGDAWGLANEPYIAKNTQFVCGGKGGGSLDDSVGLTSENLLGLASTGNTAFIYNLLMFAVVTTGVGILLTKSKTQGA